MDDTDFLDFLNDPAGSTNSAPTMNTSFLDKLLDTGLGALGVVTSAQTAKNNAALNSKLAAAAQANANKSAAWLPIVIIGGAIALVVVLIVALKK